MRIQPNCMVTLAYRIEPEDEASFPYPRGPFRMQALVGYDRLLPVLEEGILGLAEGDRTEVTVPAEAWSGAVAQEAVAVPLADIIDARDVQVGRIYHIMDRDARLQPFRVVAMEGDHVLADFHAPQAQGPLRFQIAIEAVRWARLDEIQKILQPLKGGR